MEGWAVGYSFEMGCCLMLNTNFYTVMNYSIFIEFNGEVIITLFNSCLKCLLKWGTSQSNQIRSLH